MRVLHQCDTSISTEQSSISHNSKLNPPINSQYLQLRLHSTWISTALGRIQTFIILSIFIWRNSIPACSSISTITTSYPVNQSKLLQIIFSSARTCMLWDSSQFRWRSHPTHSKAPRFNSTQKEEGLLTSARISCTTPITAWNSSTFIIIMIPQRSKTINVSQLKQLC